MIHIRRNLRHTRKINKPLPTLVCVCVHMCMRVCVLTVYRFNFGRPSEINIGLLHLKPSCFSSKRKGLFVCFYVLDCVSFYVNVCLITRNDFSYFSNIFSICHFASNFVLKLQLFVICFMQKVSTMDGKLKPRLWDHDGQRCVWKRIYRLVAITLIEVNLLIMMNQGQSGLHKNRMQSLRFFEVRFVIL